MRIALTRSVPPSLASCELTFLDRVPIDVAGAAREHDQYEDVLRSLGCKVQRLPDEPTLPDSVFVEDAAIVCDEIAVITRPGAESRRAETATVANALQDHRDLCFIEAPGTMDGGDVLVVGYDVFAGISQRTNLDGIRQLETALQPHGYRVHALPLRGCLHLKSAVTSLPDGRVLLNPEWVDMTRLGVPCIPVDAAEPLAANVLHIEGTVICADHTPRTIEALRVQGFSVITTPMQELAKAEAGVTCCSVIFLSIR